MIRYGVSLRLVAGVLMGGVLACADETTGPEPGIEVDPAFNEAGGLAVLKHDFIGGSQLDEAGLTFVPFCTGDVPPPKDPEHLSGVYWVPGGGVAEVVAAWPKTLEFRPRDDPPWGPLLGPDPINADTAVAGPLRLVAYWPEEQDFERLRVADYPIDRVCERGGAWISVAKLVLENLSDTVVVLDYVSPNRFRNTRVERHLSATDITPLDLVPTGSHYFGDVSGDTLSPGERVVAYWIPPLHPGGKPQTLGTYYFELELNRAEEEPPLRVGISARIRAPLEAPQ